MDDDNDDLDDDENDDEEEEEGRKEKARRVGHVFSNARHHPLPARARMTRNSYSCASRMGEILDHVYTTIIRIRGYVTALCK